MLRLTVHLHVGEVVEVVDLLRRRGGVGADEHDAGGTFTDRLQRLLAHVTRRFTVVL